MIKLILLLLVFVCLTDAQDPADSWLAWAFAECPNNGRITRLEATNLVPPTPTDEDAGYPAFWFGIEDKVNFGICVFAEMFLPYWASNQSKRIPFTCSFLTPDYFPKNNVNLIQPIVPAWAQCQGDGYCVFNEQFRWHGMRNWNGEQVNVQPGDTLFASVILAQNGTYIMTIRISGSVNYTITDLRTPSVLEGYNFSHAFFVVEHHESCDGLPPQPIIYKNIRLDCDYKRVVSPKWTSNKGSNPICDAEATVDTPTQITLSWSNSDDHGL